MEQPSPSVLKKNVLKAKIQERPVQSAVARKRAVNAAAQNKGSDQKEAAQADGKKVVKANFEPYTRPVSALSKNPSRPKLEKDPPPTTRNAKDMVNLYDKKGHKASKFKSPYASSNQPPVSTRVPASAAFPSGHANQHPAPRIRNDPKAQAAPQNRQVRDGEGLRANQPSAQAANQNANLSRMAQQAKYQGQRLIKEY